MTVRVDAVVVSYNSRDTLRDCVAPLARIAGVDVTVVDNGSADGSLDTIADLPVRAIESGRNGGFGFGCNLGVASGSAPYVLFINPDARIEPADLDRLAAVLDAEPDVAVVGPRVLDDAGRLFPSQRRYQRPGSTWAQALFLHRPLRRAAWANEIIRQDSAYDRPAYPEWLSGACMLARRDVVEAVGGFDEGFFLYCEDKDLCRRIGDAGFEVRYEPAAHAVHAGHGSAPQTALFGVLTASRVRYARKHDGAVAAALERLGGVLMALTHIAVTTGARRAGYAGSLLAAAGRMPARPN